METDEPTDGTLALRVRGEHGDREAEAALFRRFAPRIRLYGLRHLRDEAKADDLVQHVMMLLIENLREGRVREPERLASFVLGSCRMVVLNLKRGDGRRQRLLDHYGLPGETPSDRSTELDLERLRACVVEATVPRAYRGHPQLLRRAMQRRHRARAHHDARPATCAWCDTAPWAISKGAWDSTKRRPRDPTSLLVASSAGIARRLLGGRVDRRGDRTQIEDHIFSCDSCTSRLSTVANLARGKQR